MNRNLLVSVLVYCIAFTSIPFAAVAQLRLVPAPPQKSAERHTSSSGRIKALTPKLLPFWDDFSFPSGHFPNDTLWENSNSIWINNGIGINSPSLGVATFDGLDSIGQPYSGEVLLNGFRDKLVSRPIRLDTVAVALRNTTYLSFFFQWQGNGETPENTDYLSLDFKNDDDEWIEQFKIVTRPGFDKTKFYDTIHLVNGAQFFHRDFQFRFRTYGRQSGPYDTWNIDYVYLDKGRNTVNYNSYPDRALASGITSLLGRYRAVPLEHFLNGGTFSPVSFDIQHLRNFFLNAGDPAPLTAAIRYDVFGTFRNYFTDGTDTTYTDFTDNLFASSNGIPIAGLQRLTQTAPALPDTTNDNQFDPDAIGVDIKLKLSLASDDSLDADTRFRFQGIDTRVNDTLSATYSLRDFYAYDDGTPEFSVLLTQSSNRALLEFEMETDQDDILAGFDIYMPDYGIPSNLNMDFIIHSDDGDQPSEEPILTIPDFSVTRQGYGKFVRVKFIPGIQVGGKFYIGWVAPVEGKPKVGFDVSNDAGDRIWVNTNDFWENNPDDLHGSIMIRPFFGEGELVTGIPEQESEIAVFPNPNRGEFTVHGTYDALTILSSTGQVMGFREQKYSESSTVSFTASPGLYIVQLSKRNKVITKKIMVVQ